MIAPAQVRGMPVRWAVVFAVVCALALGGAGYIAGDRIGSSASAQSPERHLVDVVLVPDRTGARMWQVRWLAWDEPRIILVEGDEAKDRLVAWIGEGR
jgi:hypothetical protein